MICPTCKRKAAGGEEPNPYRPFCSDRCRLIDLGAWLEGAHRIASPISEDDSEEVFPRDDDNDQSGPN